MTATARNFGIGLIFLLGLSTTALAYGPAGCGLGSLIIQKDTIVSQALASTTNQTFFLNQFFGITFGTSNCNTNGFVMREHEAQEFAEANMQNLEVDMARGHGESLAAFAQILGCHQNSISDFGRMTQVHYESIFPKGSVDAQKFIRSVEVEMIKDTPVRQGCLGQTS